MKADKFISVPRELLNVIEQELRQGSYEQQEVLDLLSKPMTKEQDKILKIISLLDHISGDYNGETGKQIAEARDHLSELV